MSNLFAAERAAGATAVPVWTQPRRAAPFTSCHEALQDHGEPDGDVEPEAEPEEERVDLDAVRAASIAQGYAAGLEAGRREADKERDALERLAEGCEVRLDALGSDIMFVGAAELPLSHLMDDPLGHPLRVVP